MLKVSQNINVGPETGKVKRKNNTIYYKEVIIKTQMSLFGQRVKKNDHKIQEANPNILLDLAKKNNFGK